METKTKENIIKKVNESRVYVSEEEWNKLSTLAKLELIALSMMSGEDIENTLTGSFNKYYILLSDNDDKEYLEYCENCDKEITQIEIEGEFVCPNCKRGDCILLFDKKEEVEIKPKSKETAIAILDLFEELLAEHDITIPSNDREGNKNEARLYGGEYYNLEENIIALLNKN